MVLLSTQLFLAVRSRHRVLPAPGFPGESRRLLRSLPHVRDARRTEGRDRKDGEGPSAPGEIGGIDGPWREADPRGGRSGEAGENAGGRRTQDIECRGEREC